METTNPFANVSFKDISRVAAYLSKGIIFTRKFTDLFKPKIKQSDQSAGAIVGQTNEAVLFIAQLADSCGGAIHPRYRCPVEEMRMELEREAAKKAEQAEIERRIKSHGFTCWISVTGL